MTVTETAISEQTDLSAIVEELDAPPRMLRCHVFWRRMRQDFPDKSFDSSLEAQPGFIWLTADQWRSLIPAKPKVGDTFPMPALVADPIIRTRLHPHLAFGHSIGWREKDVRSSALTLTVEEASPRQHPPCPPWRGATRRSLRSRSCGHKGNGKAG